MSESATPESGPLSVDQAIAALNPEPVEQEAPEAPIEAAGDQEIEAEASPAEESEDAAETPAEEDEAEPEPEAVAPVDPPAYWSKDAKARFAELTPELQAVVLEQEGPREAAAAKAKADAAAVRQHADAEVARISRLSQELSEFLPQAIETFQSRWGSDPDWVAYATEHGAEAMTLAKAQHEAEAKHLQRLAAASEDAEAVAQQAFVRAEFEKLAEIAPDLADPEQGSEKRTAVTRYLVKQGIKPEALRQISAAEMLIAQKAMRWDETQAALQAKPKPKPASATTPHRAPVRPAAAVAQSSSRSTLQQAQSRFNLDPSTENATALLLAQKARPQ